MTVQPAHGLTQRRGRATGARERRARAGGLHHAAAHRVAEQGRRPTCGHTEKALAEAGATPQPRRTRRDRAPLRRRCRPRSPGTISTTLQQALDAFAALDQPARHHRDERGAAKGCERPEAPISSTQPVFDRGVSYTSGKLSRKYTMPKMCESCRFYTTDSSETTCPVCTAALRSTLLPPAWGPELTPGAVPHEAPRSPRLVFGIGALWESVIGSPIGLVVLCVLGLALSWAIYDWAIARSEPGHSTMAAA